MMKAKKGKKTRKSFSDSCNLSNASDTANQILQPEISPNDDLRIPSDFKVLFDANSKESKQVLSNNIIFLHPLVIETYKYPRYCIVKGANSIALCLPIPLKRIHITNAFFPKENVGFIEGELVKLFPYDEKIQKVDKVSIRFSSKVTIDDDLKGKVQEALINKGYLYKGMQIKEKYLQEFTIDGYSDLNSMFSSLNLGDREDSGLKSPEFQVNRFFTVDFSTVLSINLDGVEKMASTTHLFSQIGGCKSELQCIRLLIHKVLNPEKNQKIDVAVLLLGPSGIGKTLILEAISNEYNVPIEEISWANLYARSLPEAKQELHRIFQRINSRDQCIILIDDFQYLCPKVGDVESDAISRLLLNLIDDCVAGQFLIIATANTPDYDVSVLRRNILKEIHLKIPDLNDREEILNVLLVGRQHNLSGKEIKDIAVYSQGFTGRDLRDILDDAETIQALRNQENCSKAYITYLNVMQALKLKKPSIVESSMKIKEVKWSDIGGMQGIKEKLLEIVEGPLRHPELYKQYGIPPSRGILLYGPPGCSKTMIAKALATECNFNFISKNVSDIENKYVGESEKAVRDLFVMARAKSPCIIFLDEIDALVPSRGSSGGSGVEDRIVNSFLQEMDGIEELRDVLIVAATNRPDRLDEAFIRHGRINHFIYVPLPDMQTREEILHIRMKNRKVADDFDFKYLASKTNGYSGAEIVNLCNEAAFLLLAEDMNCQLPVFTLNHMEKALKTIIPRTTKEMLDFYEDFNSKYISR